MTDSVDQATDHASAGTAGQGASAPESQGFWRRTLRRLATSTNELEAEQLREASQAAGCVPVARCGDRDQVSLHGSVATVTLRPRGGVCTLEAELDDGSGTVTLVWLGQRRIAGVAPGREMTVTGRLSCHRGQRVLYNPRYELSA